MVIDFHAKNQVNICKHFGKKFGKLILRTDNNVFYPIKDGNHCLHGIKFVVSKCFSLEKSEILPFGLELILYQMTKFWTQPT